MLLHSCGWFFKIKNSADRWMPVSQNNNEQIWDKFCGGAIASRPLLTRERRFFNVTTDRLTDRVVNSSGASLSDGEHNIQSRQIGSLPLRLLYSDGAVANSRAGWTVNLGFTRLHGRGPLLPLHECVCLIKNLRERATQEVTLLLLLTWALTLDQCY